MVEKLRELFERVQQQPPDVQKRIAEVIQLELEEEADEEEASPELLARLEESRRQIAAGDYVEYEEYARKRRERERE